MGTWYGNFYEWQERKERNQAAYDLRYFAPYGDWRDEALREENRLRERRQEETAQRRLETLERQVKELMKKEREEKRWGKIEMGEMAELGVKKCQR